MVFRLIYGRVIMPYHERAGTDKAAKAGSARLVRAVPALASLLLPFLPLAGGDHVISRKDHRGGRVADAGVVF